MSGAIRKRIKAGVGVAKDGLDAALLALDHPRIDRLMDQVENLTEAGPGSESDLARVLAARVLKRVRSVRDSLVATVKRPKKATSKTKRPQATKAKKARAKVSVGSAKVKRKLKVRAAKKKPAKRLTSRRAWRSKKFAFSLWLFPLSP